MATQQRTKSDIITVESSMMVTQNILMVLLSQLCFVRNIFPEEAFLQSKFGNCMIRAIQKGVCDDADRMIKWLEDGVFSLLQKGNLCMMVFGIYVNKDCPSEFVEAWYFKVGCSGDLNVRRDQAGSSQSVLIGTTKQEVKDLSQQFVRTVISLGGCLQDLPMERYLTMRIVHEDDGSGYRPPEFMCAFENSQELVRYAMKPSTLSLGSIATPYNSVSLKLKTTIEDQAYEPTPTQPSQGCYTETDNEVDRMWQSDSDSEDESGSSKELFSDQELTFLFELTRCVENTMSRSTHQLLKRMSVPVLKKMIEIGAIVPISIPINENTSFAIHRNVASRLYQGQVARQRTPDIAMSQLSVASPASSTIYVDPPQFATKQSEFGGGVPRHRTFAAIPPSSPFVQPKQPTVARPQVMEQNRDQYQTLQTKVQSVKIGKQCQNTSISTTKTYPCVVNDGISKPVPRQPKYGVRAQRRT